ncbi:DUF262 domain-containing protein [Methylobacterium durans]|uniref:DUF262 domain-containing protein n=1 Tax=Methylobacterium durans TaxID=2202825 RepID=UPI002AFF103E|nr:DUF262 domain-containing protein [Methylobacterium durans]MEA1834077.1 DUF262 domain-containing protein [Methylobacterium durans]
MKASAAPMAVGDYCSAMAENRITVNRDYQRNPQIWKGEARSFFIESILLGYPIPKMFLYSKIDLRSRQTIKDIVDGQQRSMALFDFYNNKFRLSRNIDTEELKGRNYNQLEDEWKEAFLTYSLPIDQFAGVDETEVREAFRRMNSNNVPLNEEEKRNARYQGEFKWLVHSIATAFKDNFLRSGLMSKRDLIRMGDYKFIADVAYAQRYGVQTTKSKELDHIYRELDREFPDKDEFGRVLIGGLAGLISLTEFYGTALFKQHMAYAIVLAFIATNSGNPGLMAVVDAHSEDQYPDIRRLTLDDLLGLIDSDAPDAERHPFVVASSQKTNVREPRAVRIAYCYWAVQRHLRNEANN